MDEGTICGDGLGDLCEPGVCDGAGVCVEAICEERCPPGSTDPVASIATTVNADGSVTVRFTESTSINDNSYGANHVGWGTNAPSGKSHTFSNLPGSDRAEFVFTDNNGNVVLDFVLDYISASTSVPSGYKSLGVSGGDGKMLVGNASSILSYKTSLDWNFNDAGFGIVNGVAEASGCDNFLLTSNSPHTVSSTSYTIDAPSCFKDKWDFEIWYEVTISANAFGAAGFGSVSVPSVHNSPPKFGTNELIPGFCEPTQPGCNLAAAGPTTKDKQVEQVITNNGSATATMTGLTITWPATNGYLSKVKFDGDVIWDGTIRCDVSLCSATLPLQGALTTDAKKKSINAGAHMTLVFEFEKNAAALPSNYSWTVQFGDACFVTYGSGS